jgi:hypothetical protein
MPTLPDDEWPTGDPAMAAFAEDLRIVAGGPAPEPRPGLVAVMGRGVVVPSEPTAGRRKMLVKSVVGGVAAKIALGLGVAAASVTAVGAAGVLPEPAQHAVASVVSATTPFVLPDPSTVTARVADDETPPSTISSTTSTTSGTGDDESAGGAGRPANHGACVSAAAKDKTESDSGSHGRTVSSVARTDCGKTETPSSTTSTTVAGSTTSSTSTSTTSTTVAGTQRTTNSGPGSASSGRGNGGGNNGGDNNGSGNSGNGKGNSGKD